MIRLHPTSCNTAIRSAWQIGRLAVFFIGITLIACGEQAGLGGETHKETHKKIGKDTPANEKNNPVQKSPTKKVAKTTESEKSKSANFAKDNEPLPNANRRTLSPCLADIGKHFSEPGPFQVEQRVEGNLNLYIPKNLPADCQVPIVHYSNGTGSNCAQKELVPLHLASWGFITACFESGETGSGEQCVNAIGSMFEKFKDQALPRVGSIGHSQGGAGAISCTYLAERQWPDQIQLATHAIQPAHGMNRSNYVEEYPSIKSPIFIMSGSQDFIVSDSWIESGYKALNAETYWYRAMGITHFNIENPAKNTAVAFFRWKLLGEQDGEDYIRNLSSDAQQWTFVAAKNDDNASVEAD